MGHDVVSFRIDVPQADIEDLRDRLRRTRWPEAETVEDWSQGTPLAYARELCRYWLDEYDWATAQARLNRFPQFRTTIDGLDIHFVHVRSPHEDAVPLVMTHGWPGSVVEFAKVIEPLTDPWRSVGALVTRSTWCAQRCQDSGSAASRRGPDGARSASRIPGISSWPGSFGKRIPNPVRVPAGASIFPREIYRPSRRWAEPQFRDLRYWNELDQGGHFAAMEQTATFVDEVRAAFRLFQ
jgi:hypothetical protein